MRNANTGKARGIHSTRTRTNDETLSGMVGQSVRVSYRSREGAVSERTGTVLDMVGEAGTAKRSVVLDTPTGPRTLNLLRVTVLGE